MRKHSLLFIAHLLYWCAYTVFEVNSHVIYKVPHVAGSLMACVFITLATSSLLGLLNALKSAASFVKIVVLGSGAILIFIAWNALNLVMHEHATLQQVLDGSVVDWLEGGAYRFILLLSWAGFFMSGYIYLEKRQQNVALQTAIKSAKDAHVHLLANQLNPHFLFNALNSLDVAILQNDMQNSHEMLLKLCRFLRTILEQKPGTKIPLYQELEVLQSFVEIEQHRSRYAIQFTCETQPEANQAFVPPLIMQPLLENAIKFSRNAVKTKENLQTKEAQTTTDDDISKRGAKIELVAGIETGQLVIALENPYSETAYSETAISEMPGTKTGLNNVRERLAVIYAGTAQLIINKSNNRFCIKLVFPLEVAA